MSKRPLLSVGVLALLHFPLALQLAAAPTEAPAGGWRETVDPQRGLLEWSFRGRKLFSYVFATNQLKPYVRELYTWAGDNVLRDAPPDHLHHHGLMYAIQVNGVNFWEERDQPGHQRHRELLAHRTRDNAADLPHASFTEVIDWLPHGDHARPDPARAALLVEHRTLTLTVDRGREEVALAWESEFRVGERAERVKLHGAEYNGLGLRLPAAWDRHARHENSEGAPYPAGGAPGSVAARWGAVAHAFDGRAACIALFHRPDSLSERRRIFAMTQPFTYLAATSGLDRTSVELRQGERFRIQHLVLVYASDRSRSQLETRYQAWARALNIQPP